MYRVLRDFHDLQDAMPVKGGVVYHHYRAGDRYPRENGPVPSDARIAELCSPLNRQNAPLIAAMTLSEEMAADAAEPAAEPAGATAEESGAADVPARQEQEPGAEPDAEPDVDPAKSGEGVEPAEKPAPKARRARKKK